MQAHCRSQWVASQSLTPWQASVLLLILFIFCCCFPFKVFLPWQCSPCHCFSKWHSHWRTHSEVLLGQRISWHGKELAAGKWSLYELDWCLQRAGLFSVLQTSTQQHWTAMFVYSFLLSVMVRTADRKGARLPAWLNQQSASCPVAD